MKTISLRASTLFSRCYQTEPKYINVVMSTKTQLNKFICATLHKNNEQSSMPNSFHHFTFTSEPNRSDNRELSKDLIIKH